MISPAKSVAEYLASLPADRRQAIETVRNVILKNLAPGFEEGMQYGMIGYYVPHRLFPAGYHCDPKQPLPFAGLASQKNHMAIYLMCVYGDGEQAERFRAAWAKTGKKLDMGKSCIRFKKAEHLALELIGQTIGAVTVADFVAFYQAATSTRSSEGAARSERKTASESQAAKRTKRETKTNVRAAKPKKAASFKRLKPRGGDSE